MLIMNDPLDDADSQNPPAEPTRSRNAGRSKDRSLSIALPILTGVFFIASWALYVEISGVRPLSLPSPFAVADRLWANREILARNTWTTLKATLIGYFVSVLLGMIVATAVHTSRRIEQAIVPWLVVSQMVPLPAIAPLFVLWTGFDIRPRVMLIALVCFFPIAVSMIDGLRSVEPGLLDVLRTLRASKWQRFRLAQFPAALPSTFSGLRVAAAYAVLGAVFGEWVGSNSGLGYLIIAFNSQLRTADMLGVVVLLSVIGVVLFGTVTVVERLVLPWYHRDRKRDRK